MQTIRPARKQLFCKPDEAETVTKAGIIIAETAAERPKTAVVINVGSEVKDYTSDQRILYKSYTTNEVKLDGQEFFLVHEDDILGEVVETK